MTRGRGRRTRESVLPRYYSVSQNIRNGSGQEVRDDSWNHAFLKMIRRLSIACNSHKTLIIFVAGFIAGVLSTIITSIFIKDLYCCKALQVTCNKEAIMSTQVPISSLSSSTLSSINRDESDQGTQEDIFRKEMEDLQEMGCEPRAIKLGVAELLNSSDDLLNMDFTPKEISVKQCSFNTSYCSENQICRPTATGQRYKEMVLKIELPSAASPQTSFEKREAQNIMEHIECSCQDTECHPKPVTWRVRENLEDTDDLGDMDFSPKEIEVNQCNNNGSYCPNGKTCRSVKDSQKDKVIKLQVKSLDANFETVNWVERRIKEDTECSCQND